MDKVTYERGKTMMYPNMYPRLLVTPVFAHKGDFMWIEKIICKFDSGNDIIEPELSFLSDTVHSERNDKLVAENTRLRNEWESERDYANQMEAIAKKRQDESAKLRELVKDIEYAVDPFICGLIECRMNELGVDE